MSRSQKRRPLRSSMATMRPPWPMANTTPRSITGLPSMSLKVAMAPMRTPWTPRMSAQMVRPFSTRSAVSSPDEKGATTTPPSAAGLAPPEKSGTLLDRRVAPLHGAAPGIQGPEPVVVAHDEDAAAVDHGRRAHGHADRMPPLQGAGLRVQREHVAEARRREQPAACHREAAAEGALVVLFRQHVGGPHPGSRVGIERRDQAPRIHGEDPPAGNHRRRKSGPVVVGAAADPGPPAHGEGRPPRRDGAWRGAGSRPTGASPRSRRAAAGAP